MADSLHRDKEMIIIPLHPNVSHSCALRTVYQLRDRSVREKQEMLECLGLLTWAGDQPKLTYQRPPRTVAQSD